MGAIVMRKAVHKILTAAPMFVIAVCGVLATANPEGAKQNIEWANQQLSHPAAKWASIGFIAAYTLLWWLTSREPKSRHERLKPMLQTIYTITSGHFTLMLNASTLAEVERVGGDIDEEQAEAATWIRQNMGETAFLKFTAAVGGGKVWSGAMGQGREIRNSYLNALESRMENLSSLIESEHWDGPTPSAWTRFQRWRKDRAAPSKTAV